MPGGLCCRLRPCSRAVREVLCWRLPPFRLHYPDGAGFLEEYRTSVNHECLRSRSAGLSLSSNHVDPEEPTDYATSHRFGIPARRRSQIDRTIKLERVASDPS